MSSQISKPSSKKNSKQREKKFVEPKSNKRRKEPSSPHHGSNSSSNRTSPVEVSDAPRDWTATLLWVRSIPLGPLLPPHVLIRLHKILIDALTCKNVEQHVRLTICSDIFHKAPRVASIPNPNGMLPLHLAIKNAAKLDPPNKHKLIESLVRILPSSLTTLNLKGQTPLHVACESCSLAEEVKILLSADPRAAYMADSKGYWPIHVACNSRCSLEKLMLLLEASPDSINARSKEGFTPLDMAKMSAIPSRSNSSIIALLSKYTKSGKDRNLSDSSEDEGEKKKSALEEKTRPSSANRRLEEEERLHGDPDDDEEEEEEEESPKRFESHSSQKRTSFSDSSAKKPEDDAFIGNQLRPNVYAQAQAQAQGQDNYLLSRLNGTNSSQVAYMPQLYRQRAFLSQLVASQNQHPNKVQLPPAAGRMSDRMEYEQLYLKELVNQHEKDVFNLNRHSYSVLKGLQEQNELQHVLLEQRKVDNMKTIEETDKSRKRLGELEKKAEEEEVNVPVEEEKNTELAALEMSVEDLKVQIITLKANHTKELERIVDEQKEETAKCKKKCKIGIADFTQEAQENTSKVKKDFEQKLSEKDDQMGLLEKSHVGRVEEMKKQMEHLKSNSSLHILSHQAKLREKEASHENETKEMNSSHLQKMEDERTSLTQTMKTIKKQIRQEYQKCLYRERQDLERRISAKAGREDKADTAAKHLIQSLNLDLVRLKSVAVDLRDVK